MPILGAFGAGSAKAFGQTAGGCPPRCITFDYVIAAGGAGGAEGHGPGGGGAGAVCYSLSSPSITRNTDCGPYTFTIGAGGNNPGGFENAVGGTGGSTTAFACTPVAITLVGGGGGGYRHASGAPSPQGSGGGAGCLHAGQGPGSGGSGGPLGTPGGNSPGGFAGAGGGGRCTGGQNSSGPPSPGGNGGLGVVLNITGTCQNYGCGGGGGAYHAPSCGSVGGRGCGGKGKPNPVAADRKGTENTGSGGGGGGGLCGAGNGGSGVVVLRFPSACRPGKMAVSPGCNTITTSGTDTIVTFNVTGCLSFV